MKGVWYKHQSDIYTNKDRFFVAREKGSATKLSYEFASYESVEHFATILAAQRKKKPETAIYHECIPAWRARRIHFDIDYAKKLLGLDSLIEQLLEACDEELIGQGYSLDPDTIWCLDSSTEKKTSVHIILSAVAAQTHEECEKFCMNVIRALEMKIPESLYDSVRAIDRGIYTSNRNFRMAYCTKKGQSRYLVPRSFTWRGTVYEHPLPEKKEEYVLPLTVIGLKNTDSVNLVHYDIVKRVYAVSSRLLTEEDVMRAVDLAKSKLTESEWCFPGPYKAKDGSIALERKGNKGPCRICREIHERENSSLSVSSDGRVMFRCWRAEDRPDYLGTISANGEVIERASTTILAKYMGLTRGEDTRKLSSDIITDLILTFGYIEKGTAK